MKLLTLKTTIVLVAIVLVAVMVDASVKWLIRNHQLTMTNTCIENLQVIDAGKQQWALETQKSTNAVPTWDDLNPYIINTLIDKSGFGSKMLVCPAGGTYTIGRMAVAPTCSTTNHFLAGDYGPEPDYSVVPVIPINDETISSSLSAGGRSFRGPFDQRPLAGQPSADAWWKTKSFSAHITVYSDQLIPDANSFQAFWTSLERQKSGEPLSVRAQRAAKETAQGIASYVANNITNISFPDTSTNAGYIRVQYRQARNSSRYRPAENSSSLEPTAAYARTLVHLMTEEANRIARHLQLPEDLPITETNLLATLSLPAVLIHNAMPGMIETRKYSYTFGSSGMVFSIERRYFSESLDEIKTKYLIPIDRMDTNAALIEALQIMAAGGVDTNALTRDCSVAIKAALPGGSSGAVFVPCYRISWSLADPNSPIKGSLAAELEFFEPTHAVESLNIHQPKYILRQPLPPLDFLSLLTPENSREAVLNEIKSEK